MVDAFGTHAKFLKAAVSWAKTRKAPSQKLKLFEIGTGGQSSKLFNREILSNTDAALVAFENNPEWIGKYRESYKPLDRVALREVEIDSDWGIAVSAELSKLDDGDFVLAFIDSSPFSSRVQALNSLRTRADIILIHDVDYFPHNNLFGTEREPIRKKPKPRVGPIRLDAGLLGRRDYSDVFSQWKEVFPKYAGSHTGPPTLIGSNRHDLEGLTLPKGTIIQSSSTEINMRED